MVLSNEINNFTEEHSEQNVSFIVKLSPERYNSLDDDAVSLQKWLKLESSHSLKNMHLISGEQRVQRVDLGALCDQFSATRLHFYGLRKERQLAELEVHASKAHNKSRFVELVASGSISLTRTKQETTSRLHEYGFDSIDGILRACFESVYYRKLCRKFATRSLVMIRSARAIDHCRANFLFLKASTICYKCRYNR